MEEVRWLVFLILVLPEFAHADDCYARLDELQVDYRVTGPIPGVEMPVEVMGPLGGVTYRTGRRDKTLILDCSLVYSLALAGRYFVDEGLTSAVYSDSYERRFVRGTTRWSKHSFGLALDVHRWQSQRDPSLRLAVEDDYQTGLGRGRDCIGHPGSERARSLRTLWCRLTRSELFRLVLDPDFDEDHRDHFHIQAPAWHERTDLEWRDRLARGHRQLGGHARAGQAQRHVEQSERPDQP
jgi:hypothetical protein